MAQQLWLLRHGEAEPHDARDDFDRELTERGRAQSAAAGRALAALKVSFQMAFTSPKVRALETARLACAELGVEPVEHAPLADGFDAREALALVAAAGEEQRVLIVGHEPDFSRVAGDLTGGRVDVKKGGLVGIRVDGAGGELIVVLRPREIDQIGLTFEPSLLDFAGTLFMPEPEVDGVLAAAASLGAPLERAEAERLAAAYDAAGRPGGPYPATVPVALADAYARRDLGSDEHRAAYVGLLSTVDAPVPGLAEALYERLRVAEGFVPYADTPRLLAGLRDRGLRTALVSNIGFDLRPVLAGHGLTVDAYALSCELGVTKPDPRIFHAACEALGVAPAEALMVGDHVADGGASDAGLRTLLLPMTPAGSEHGLDAVLRVLDALQAALPP